MSTKINLNQINHAEKELRASSKIIFKKHHRRITKQVRLKLGIHKRLKKIAVVEKMPLSRLLDRLLGGIKG